MDYKEYDFIQKALAEDTILSQCYHLNGERFMVAEVKQEAVHSLSGLMAEEKYPDIYASYQYIMKQQDCDYALLLWSELEEERMVFLSRNKRIRALEFLDYLIADYGLIKGDASCASGQISTAILSVQMAAADIADSMEYFMRMSNAYFHECDWIDAGQYGTQHELEISELPRYTKRKNTWFYVESTRIVDEGKEFVIKSLENESGLRLTASPDVYVMIGCRGEIYDISREKFERTYQASEKQLDIIEQMLDFLPAVETVPEREYIGLDEIAHLCYPKPDSGIFAKELTKRTKVYPVDKEQEYFLGHPGDYMAVRPDDFCDIYIIQREIFKETYEKV
jgi:phosphoglycolate phosphatase